MADAAARKMTADEFFDWDSGDDRRYQLIDGLPVAMAPPSDAHAVLLARLAQKIGEALEKRPPCAARIPGALRSAVRNDRVWEPDLAVTCKPHVRGQKGTVDPLLVIEILSPGTERGDRVTKMIDYQLIPSIEEIVLLHQDRIIAEVYRRDGSKWTIELVASATQVLRLRSIDAEIPLGLLYERIDLA